MDHVELGKRLRASREGVGLNQQDVADDLKVPRTAISLIESGQRQVSTMELTRMAALYRRSVAELLTPGVPDEEDYLLVLHRMAPELEGNPQVKADVETCLDLCRTGIELERALGLEARQAPPNYALATPRNAAEAVSQGVDVANKERLRLGFGTAPIRDLSARINEQGVWAVSVRLNTDMSGLFMRHPTIGRVVITNAQHPQSRRRFSLAHEYGHALMDFERRIQLTTMANAQDLVEQRANAFAAAFLLPADGVEHFLSTVGKGGASRLQQSFYDVASNGKFEVESRERPNSQTITAQDIAMLATSFGASYEAVTYRLNSLRYLDRAETQELRVKADLGRRYIELLGKIPTDDNGGTLSASSQDPELRSQILHLAMEAFRREQISQGRLLEVGRKLGIDGRTLLDFANTERPVASE
jgi:Zn-dependent peptidase ImmA (M78 family)/transcriptional regulator with XRE-family HTH domain